MLGSPPMKRAALSIALVAATSSIASAGGYVGIGVGTNALSDSEDRLVEDGRSARVFGGYRFRPMRFGSFAVEAGISGYGIGLKDRTSVVEMDAYQLSLAARFDVPLGSNFDAFGRLGIQHTTAGAENPIYDTSGNGFLVGAGLAYRFDARVGKGAAVSIDYQINKVDLEGERLTTSVTERQWTLGLALSF